MPGPASKDTDEGADALEEISLAVDELPAVDRPRQAGGAPAPDAYDGDGELMPFGQPSGY